MHVGLPDVVIDIVAFQTHQQKHYTDLDARCRRGQEQDTRQRDCHAQSEERGRFGSEESQPVGQTQADHNRGEEVGFAQPR